MPSVARYAVKHVHKLMRLSPDKDVCGHGHERPCFGLGNRMRTIAADKALAAV